jgi:hypothetical protein
MHLIDQVCNDSNTPYQSHRMNQQTLILFRMLFEMIILIRQEFNPSKCLSITFSDTDSFNTPPI